jgi:hypothetical protein
MKMIAVFYGSTTSAVVKKQDLCREGQDAEIRRIIHMPALLRTMR